LPEAVDDAVDRRGDRRRARFGDLRALLRLGRGRRRRDRAEPGRIDRQGRPRGPAGAEGVPVGRREEARREGRELEELPRRGDEGGCKRVVTTAPLDIGDVQASADRVLAEEMYWFPVRHHSPAVARHLRAAIRARKPKLVLIEGPAHASDLIKYVVDAKTKPPVALYSSFRDDGNL